MAFLKVTIFVAFACLVNAVPQVRKLDAEGGWKQTATISSQTTVYDGTLKEVALINITVATWNLTQDSYQMVSNSVRHNLANIQGSEITHGVLKVYEGENNNLPLAFNLTVFEVVSTGPTTARSAAIELQVNVYAKKHHQADVLGALKHFSL